MSGRRGRSDGLVRLIAGLGPVCALLFATAAAGEPSLSQRVHDQIIQAQELIGQEQAQDALARLQSLSTDAGLSPYEAAVVNQTRGYAHAALEQFEQAADAFGQSLAAEVLPPESAQSVRYNLAQVWIAAQRYTEGAQVLEAWLAEQDQPRPQARVLLAQVYSQLKRYAEAEQHMRWALDQATSFREEWHRLLLFVSVEQQKWSRAVEVLHQLLDQLPHKKTYWLQLAQVYRQTEQQYRAVSTLALAHKLGLLEEREVLDVVQSYLHHGLPYKAADILTEGLRTQVVAKTEAHHELLVSCWLHAKEYQRALDVLEQTGREAQTGRADIRRAELLVQLERWPEAAAAADLGLTKGGLDDSGRAYILLGIAEYRSGNLADSRAAFRQATRQRGVAKQARQWLRLIGQEENRPL